MRPRSIHNNFFSSLKQVEKRLKVENPPPPPPPPESSYTSTESLSSPIHVHFDQSTLNSSTFQDIDSEPPLEFLTNSPNFHENPPHESKSVENSSMDSVENRGIDNEIDSLMKLLGLPDHSIDEEKGKVGLGLGWDCGCDDEFYDKIVGVRGPKCEKEVERLDGWIKYFLSERIEALRLAHLLLAKAAFVSMCNSGVGGLEFPSTVDEFLRNDPPAD